MHTHTHNCVCMQHYFSAYVNLCSRPLACCWPILCGTLTSLCISHLHSQLLFVCFECCGVWLGGWAYQWHSPQGLSEHKHCDYSNSNSENIRSRIVASLWGSVGMRKEEGESSAGQIWAAGFHHLMACPCLVHVFKFTDHLFL